METWPPAPPPPPAPGQVVTSSIKVKICGSGDPVDRVHYLLPLLPPLNGGLHSLKCRIQAAWRTAQCWGHMPVG